MNSWKNNLKKAFEKREIQPSDNVWELLENRLEKNQNTPKSRKIWWLAAASVAFVLLVWQGLKTSNEQIIPQEKNTITSTDTINKNEEKTPSEDEKIVKTETVTETHDNLPKTQHSTQTKPHQLLTNNAVVLTEKNPTKTANDILVLPDLKNEETVAEKQYLSAGALLSSVENEIETDQFKASVSANELLSEAEKEVRKEKRKDFFEKINHELKRIQVALEENVIN